MKLIWIVYIIEVLIVSIFKPIINDFEVIGLIMLLVHLICTTTILLTSENKYKKILLLAYYVRILTLIFDLYGRSIFVLPNSGADSEDYYQSAFYISENLSRLGTQRLGIYADFKGILLNLIGPNRIFSQYFNVVLSISVMGILISIMQELKVSSNRIKKLLLVYALFPNNVIISSLFLRESIIIFLVAVSLYHFIKWFNKNRVLDSLLSVIYIFIGMAFHSGVVGVLAGYLIGFLFYQKNKGKFIITFKTIISFLALLILMLVSYNAFGDYLFRKFGDISNTKNIYITANRVLESAGSLYLQNLEINGLLDMIIKGPIKAVYFLFSPMPLDWRGIFDIISFFLDSSFYLFTLIYAMNGLKKNNRNKNLSIILIISILATSYIFGIGVSNAGTAIRHRQKIISLFIILLSISGNTTEKTNIEIDKNKF